jgi:arylsulfatase A-like enzyme
MFQPTGPAEPIEDHTSIPFWLLPGSPRDRRPYVAAYDDDIAAVDAAVDTLVREFRAVRQSRENVVVVTADHGEQFLDHGGWEHGSNLYDELVGVPLAILGARYDRGSRRRPGRTIDLFSTLLELANADIP